jgi:hypothetical protein
MMETVSSVSAVDQGAVSPPAENTRLAAALVPSITGLRLSPHGAEATLVNISTTGLLAECDIRLKVGSPLTVLFEGAFKPTSASGRVVRCAVAAMGKNGRLLYHVGVAFDNPIPLAEATATPKTEREVPSPGPASVRAVVRNRW